MAVVLLYHRVNVTASDPWGLNVSPGHFNQQLEVLRRHYRPISLAELASEIAEERLDERAVVLTFDDGYADNLCNAVPLLEAFEVPATFFVPSGHIGADREYWWDELDALLLQPGDLPRTLSVGVEGERLEWDLAEAARYTVPEALRHARWVAWEAPPTPRHGLYAALWTRCYSLRSDARAEVLQQLRVWAAHTPLTRLSHRVMDRSELNALASSPYAAIGAHTVSHPRLASLSQGDQRAEIVDSKRNLEKTLGCSIDSFAYPFGKHSDYTSETVSAVRDAEFACACINEPGRVDRATPLREIPRLFVRDLPGTEFEQWLSAKPNVEGGSRT